MRLLIRLSAAVLVLGAIFSISGGFPGGRIVCEARETGTAAAAQKKGAASVEQEEVTEFVAAYRKAFSREGVDTLADYVDDPEDEEFQKNLLRNKVMCNLGFANGWENVKVIAKPMSDGKHWVASVSGDLFMDDLDYGIPGLNVVLVERNAAGELKIVMDSDKEFSDAFLEEIRRISLSDEIVDQNNEIAASYNALLAEHPELVELLESAHMLVEKELSETLEEQLPVKANSDAEKDGYTVKKGDCLWNIAEEQLGDGMLWSGLYKQNQAVIGENPDLLYVGITLQLN